KGLIYEGFRVLAYCWRCETPLSNTETRMDDVYRERTDPAATVWFHLPADPQAPEPLRGPLRALAWTTMPWTLVPNVALVVHPDVRSEEHTSELQSRENLVCRLLLEKKI